MSAPEFFIADDAHGDPVVWRKDGNRPIAMLDLSHLTLHDDGRALLDLIRAAVEGEVREEWGVRLSKSPHPHLCTSKTVAVAVAESWAIGTPLRRTVITGAWEEER